MDPITAAIGTALAVGGFVEGLFGKKKAKKQQRQANKISKKISGLSQDADNLRKEAATNEYLSSTRTVMRNAQVARATALANAVNQGAQYDTSLQGGYGQIENQAGAQTAELTGGYNAGQSLFDINSQITALDSQRSLLLGRAQKNANRGKDLMQLGMSIAGNSTQISNTLDGVGNLFAGA